MIRLLYLSRSVSLLACLARKKEREKLVKDTVLCLQVSVRRMALAI